MRGGAQPTRAVSVTLDAVGPIDNRGADGQIGVSDDPDRYWVDRHIELYTQHYLQIRERSQSIPWIPGSDAEPAGPTGWVPDALIPHRQPFDVPAGRNQGLWIDLYIPRDAPAGLHRGTARIHVAGEPCPLPACILPIELEVLPHTLPDEPPVKTMLASTGAEGEELEHVFPYYFADYQSADPEQIAAIHRRHFQLARRYRVTLVAGYEHAPSDSLRRRLSGETFSRAAGYTGPGENIGQDVYGIYFFGGALTPAQASTWHSWLSEHAPDIDAFLYVVDEPSDDTKIPHYNQVARDAEPIAAFVTERFDPRFDEFEIFASPTWTYGGADRAQATWCQEWVYNGERPFSGSFMIDDVAISTRVNPWIQYRRDIPRWFYWESTYYNDFQGKRGYIDVWQQPLNFSNHHGDRMNGDGLLMYPGRSYLFPESDLGIDRPLPSIRLANWRRGIEDVGYLELARAAGHDALVERVLDTLIPRYLDRDVREDEPVSWPEDGERWLAARRILFDALAGNPAPSDDNWAALARPSEPLASWARRIARRGQRFFFGSGKRIAASALSCVLAGLALTWWWRRRRTATRHT